MASLLTPECFSSPEELPAGSPVSWDVGVGLSRGLANISECVLGISSHPHPSRYELNCLGELAWGLGVGAEGSSRSRKKKRAGKRGC